MRPSRIRQSLFATAMAWIASSAPVHAEGGIILTFDDDYVAQWHQIRGLLNELGVRATFFISNYHALDSTQRQYVADLASDGHEIAAHSYQHANASTYCPGNGEGCVSSDQERAENYIDEQILTQLAEMASDGIYPRNFAYPYGGDLPETTDALFGYFDYVRDTSYYPTHGASYVACGGDRFIAGLGIDERYNVTEAEYDLAMAQLETHEESLVWYGHQIEGTPPDYYVGEGRLRDLIESAQMEDLEFHRLRDVCSWQTIGLGTTLADVHASSRPLDSVAFGDFNGDGLADAFRTNGLTWEVLHGQGTSFFTGTDTEHWQHLNNSAFRLEDLRLGDFDGDGVTDVFRTNGVVWSISDGGTGAWAEARSSSHALENLRFHDFDGDGATDVFVSSGGDWQVSHGAQSAWSYLSSSANPIESLRFGDFDGGGTTDVFISSGGEWFVRYGGVGTWSPINTSEIGVGALALADLDADGRADVVRSTGTEWLVSYAGTSAWSHWAESEKAIPDAAFADLDGDGGMEILVVDEPIATPEPGLGLMLAMGVGGLLVVGRPTRWTSVGASTNLLPARDESSHG